MNRPLLLIFVFFSVGALHAQNLSTCQQVIGTTGTAKTESGLRYAYTVGEPIIFTLKKPGVNVEITQGFHQPDVCLPVSGVTDAEWAGWDIQVYPNPATDFLQVLHASPNAKPLQAMVVNAEGKQISGVLTLSANGDQIDLRQWVSGHYFMVMTHPDNGATATVQFVVMH